MANRNYLTYIATRENVDLGNEQKINLIKEDIAADWEIANEQYLTYISDRPRSHGLFGNIDTQDLKGLSKRVSELTEHGRNIYKVIISLSEKDAQLLGYTNKDKWNEYLKATIPDLAKSLGMSIYDHTWVAAYHAEKGHPHVHVMLWDNKDKIKSPFIPVAIQHECRKIASEKMFSEEYENSLKNILKAEREELIEKKNVARTDIITEFKNIFLSVEPVNGNEICGLPEKIHTGDLNFVTKQLDELKNLLPVSGKIMYKYMPEEIKEKIDAITDRFLERKDFKNKVQEYVHATVELQRMQGKVEKQLVYAEQRAMGELHNRAGNIILKGLVFQMQHISSMADKEIQNDVSKICEPSDMKIELLEQTIDVTGCETEYYTEGAYKKGPNMYQQAKACLKEKDYEKAMELFKKCAEKGHGFAMYQIGVLYADEKIAAYYDAAQAEEWLKKAAEFENHAAAYQLAQLYADETKPLYDISKAMKWYEEAALYDNDMAMYKLGKLYIDYVENSEFYHKGIDWLKRAADEYGNTYAQYTLGNVFHQQEDDDMAFHYWSRAADADNEYGIWRVGRCYLWGIGVEKDVDKGMEYLKYAVEKYESKFAAREMENYNSMSFKALSYGIFRMFFDELTRLTNQSKRRVERLEHEKSRQAKKEEVLHRE